MGVEVIDVAVGVVDVAVVDVEVVVAGTTAGFATGAVVCVGCLNGC